MSARSLAVLTAVFLGAVPATASAANTWTVDPLMPNAGACDPASFKCKTITQADTAAKDGDTILIKDGSYAEAPLVFDQQNLTVRAENPGKVRVTSSSTTAGADVIAVGRYPACSTPIGVPNPAQTCVTGLGDRTTIEGLVVTVQPGGGQAVEVRAKNVSLKHNTLLRPEPPLAAEPVVSLDTRITSGTLYLLRNFIGQGAGTSPAVVNEGSGPALSIIENRIFTNGASGIQFSDPVPEDNNNLLIRSEVIVSEGGGNAVEVISDDAEPTVLVIDTSILSGGESGAGIYAESQEFIDAAGGNIRINAVQTTVAGAAKSVSIDAEAPDSPFPAGNVIVSFNHSIVRGPVTALSGGAFIANNTVNVDIVNSDTDAQPAANVTANGNSNTPDAQLFADPRKKNFHLRADAPVINQGSRPLPGESEQDIDLDPRLIGPATDLGADEFVNHRPVARIKADNTFVNQGQSITFDGSSSSDPDPGDRITRYRWDFGDGTTELTESPTVTHTYRSRGSFDVTLRVVDLFAFGSELDKMSVGVRDATRPTISILRPSGARALRASRGLNVGGRATDESGISSVRFSLRLLRRANGRRVSGCLFFNGLEFVKRSCTRPLQLRASISRGSWRYRIPRSVRLPKGTYQMRARATDGSGVLSRTATRHFRLR